MTTQEAIRDIMTIPDTRMTDRGSVVNCQWAREVMYALGVGLRRDGDYMYIYRQRPSGCFYVEPDHHEKAGYVGKLNIDEGYWHGSQECGGVLRHINQPWSEYIDLVDLAHMVLRILDEDKASECHGGSFMGRGFRKQHRFRMVAEQLVSLGYWSNNQAADGEE